MKQPITEPEQEQQMRDILRHSERQLDQSTEQTLATARQAVLSRSTEKSSPFWPKFTVAMATVAIVAVLFVPTFTDNSTPQNNNQVVLQDDEIEQELEFYQWLLETGAING